MDSIKWHEWKEVSMGELLELIVDFDSILDFESSQFWKRLEPPSRIRSIDGPETKVQGLYQLRRIFQWICCISP
jgi:hypothetical protein